VGYGAEPATWHRNRSSKALTRSPECSNTRGRVIQLLLPRTDAELNGLSRLDIEELYWGRANLDQERQART